MICVLDTHKCIVKALSLGRVLIHVLDFRDFEKVHNSSASQSVLGVFKGLRECLEFCTRKQANALASLDHQSLSVEMKRHGF